ncbi:MAG: hypothetical protein V4710_00565, partial [Verrucomicrobiota bacterium]
YSLPRGFKSQDQLADEARQKAEKAKAKRESTARQKAEEAARQAHETATWEQSRLRIRAYLASLTPEKNIELEAVALMASPLGHGKISVRLRQAIIDNYILELLNKEVVE